MKTVREYIETEYGTAKLARTVALQDTESLLDVMQNYGDYVERSSKANQAGIAAEHLEVLFPIISEVVRAEAKHPNWPDDIIYAASIVGEENGELTRAAVQYEMEGGDLEEVRKEAIQTAATCIRLLINLPQ